MWTSLRTLPNVDAKCGLKSNQIKELSLSS